MGCNMKLKCILYFLHSPHFWFCNIKVSCYHFGIVMFRDLLKENVLRMKSKSHDQIHLLSPRQVFWAKYSDVDFDRFLSQVTLLS